MSKGVDLLNCDARVEGHIQKWRVPTGRRKSPIMYAIVCCQGKNPHGAILWRCPEIVKRRCNERIPLIDYARGPVELQKSSPIGSSFDHSNRRILRSTHIL